MKKLFLGSVALLCFSASMLIFQISCKKESIAQTATPATRSEILVSKTWKVDKLHHVINNQYSSFDLASGLNTTGVPYDVLRFKFNADGTGTHVNQTGNNYNLTWAFTDAAQRKLRITVDFSPSITYEWDMVELNGSYLHASTQLTVSGSSDNLETFRLVQIP